MKITDEFINEQRAIAAKATPRPWKWYNGEQTYLYTLKNGRCFVMDFVRKGMQRAQPRFSDRGNSPLGGVMYPASELNLDTHPDARYIVEAANNYPDALDEIEQLRAEVTALRAVLDPILDDYCKTHAFILSSQSWGRSNEFREGYLNALQNAISKIEQATKNEADAANAIIDAALETENKK